MMGAKRLRRNPNPTELSTMYRTPHDHRLWADHVLRVNLTSAVGHELVAFDNLEMVADLSCGNGSIAQSFCAPITILGDLASGYPYTGPIEQTIEQIPRVQLFVCCETIEHLAEPFEVLKQIRKKTDALLLSTPTDNWSDPNPEHVWSWDREYVEDMLGMAGFNVSESLYREVDTRPLDPSYIYKFSVWGLR